MDFGAEILDFESKPTFVMIGESAELVLVCGKREGKLPARKQPAFFNDPIWEDDGLF